MELEKLEEVKENKELNKLILLKLGKMPHETVCSEDFDKIEEIALNARLMNGMESGIDIQSIKLFKNLKSLKLSNYKISKEAIETVASLLRLETLEIFGAEFDEGISFEELENRIKTLRFINCLKIDFNYPKLDEVWLNQTDIDFSKIDLKTVKRIVIRNGNIENACNLTDFPNIESVNIDGSTLVAPSGEKMQELEVPKDVKYSHQSEIELLNEIK